jgi:uncharacterized membrane protein
MSHLVSHFRARPRMVGAALAGVAAGVLLPGAHGAATRALLGWNVAVWLYLALVAWMMLHADHGRLRRIAVAQAETAGTVLAIVSIASVVSLLGSVAELSAAKLPGAPHALPHVLFALATVVGSWLLLPTEFALTYASRYYREPAGGGLQFPSTDPAFKPGYADFLYFSITIAVASQTADVSVSTASMRRLVLLQSLMSFAFNTAVLAFTVNLAASRY